MKAKAIFAILIVVSMLITSIGFAADDGPLFSRNISRTPDTMTGASSMSTMWLYVPAQNTQGELVEIEYLVGDVESETTAYTRLEAKPLIITYNDGIVEEAALGTGAGFGERDAFAALSLDDGATWKNVNLSDSAARSSFTLKNGQAYPGDVFKLVHAVEGNMVAVAWISRYCESGAPLYSWLDEDKDALLAAYPELDHPVTVDGVTDPYQLYVDDMFTVGGTQISVDYAAQGFPEVGEIPYGCVWTARGTLEQDSTTGLYDIVWRASERLTSGRRDPHQINITSSPGAGFIVEWQEDPDGLRPGKGLGPGEGWSGAIANSKTDFWYTYIDLAHFDDVIDDDDGSFNLDPTADDLYLAATKPKIAVPFAMPVRITDNSQCKMPQKTDTNGDLLNPYCYADFNDNGTMDLCAETESWENPGGTILDVCVTEDGRHMTGRTASTRVRWAMKSYDSDGDGAPDSAWVAMGGEKMKALGTELDPDGVSVFDIGKNMHYYTFEFDKPALVTQGLILNAPALSPETGEPFEILIDEWENEVYDTEIARRVNLMVNSPAAAMASESKTMGILLYKQGILFQGGPADIFTRRIVLPEDFNPAEDNPFAYENVECVSLDENGVATAVDRLYPDGVNPNYVLGLCPVDGMNVSGTNLVRCTEGTPEECADAFPYDSTYEEWFAEDSNIQIPKVLEWEQCPGNPNCSDESNLNDPSWANPYDVSKGHRGFIDGDFVMMMYATAANWKANTTGNEAYQLYIRRSFDGGQTWTTLPENYTHWSPLNPEVTITADGTTAYEWYGGYGEDDYSVEYTYGPGDPEQARNVSQLAGTRVTVLDPRYSPTGTMLKKDYTSLLCNDGEGNWVTCGTNSVGEIYPEDIRDPSGFFATFETGDNTVVTVETGTVPLDMYYSRASNFGDDWDEQDACATDPEDSWYPNASVVCGEGDVELRWDWLENGDDLATEASVFGNPSGDRFYAVWNQELPAGVDDHGETIFTNQDSQWRRIFFNYTTDGLPTGDIVYVSADHADYDDPDIVLIGSSHDNDRLGPGIVSEGWWVQIGEDSHFYEGRTFQRPPNGFIAGKHDFSFVAQDNEGNWSRPKTVTIWIAEQFYDNYLPLVTR